MKRLDLQILKRIALAISMFLILFFVMPKTALSAEASWPLKQSQIENLLDIIRKDPLTKANLELYFDAISNPNSSKARETGAVVLVKQAILKKQLDYWFKKMPWELSKKFVKTAFKLIPLVLGSDIGAVISIIESLTVKEATEYATNWLLQNEIKIGAGIAQYNFYSYLKNKQELELSYIIVFHPTSWTKGNIVVEFYSKEIIEPPLGRGGPGALVRNKDHPNSTCWPWDIWLNNERKRNNDGKLEPFIVRIIGSVEKNQFDDFVWDNLAGKPIVEVEFDEPVPQIEQDDIIWQGETVSKLNFIKEKILNPGKENLLARIEEIKSGILELTQMTVDLFDKIKEKISGAKPDAQISNTVPQDLGGKISSILEELAQEFEQAGQAGFVAGQPAGVPAVPAAEGGETVEPRASLDDLVEQFDNISEQAEIVLAMAEQFLSENGHSPPPTPIPQLAETVEEELQIVLAQFEQTPPPEQKPTTSSGENNGQGSSERGIYTVTPSSNNPPPEQPSYCNLPSPNQTPSQDQVIFNEIAWMGTESSSNDEWFEIKNISSQAIDLGYWQILDQAKQIKIVLEPFTLAPDGLFLLERTDDSSLPEIFADRIYTGALSNTNEALYLFDQNCILQDQITASPAWQAGNNTTKQTMEKCAPSTNSGQIWQTSQSPNGTPRSQNQCLGVQHPNIEPPDPIEPPLEEPPDQTSTSTDQTPNQTSTSSDDSGQTPSEPPPEKPLLPPPPQEQNPPVEPSPPPLLLITQVQIQTKEFLQVFNSSDQPANLENLWLAYFSIGRNWNQPQRNWLLPANQTIPAKSHYLIGIYNFSKEEVDWRPFSQQNIPYQVQQLSNQTGAIGIFSCNPAEQTIGQAKACAIDLVGWGSPQVKESKAAQTPQYNQVLQRKTILAGNYLDTNRNNYDFEIVCFGPNSCPTPPPPPEEPPDQTSTSTDPTSTSTDPFSTSTDPTDQATSTPNLLPPNPVENFQVSQAQDNWAILTWDPATDPDTPPDQLSYILTATTTYGNAVTDVQTTTTQALTITFSNLKHNSNIEFSIRAFDGLYYSPPSALAIQTPAPAIISLGAAPSSIREAIDIFWQAPSSITTQSYVITYSPNQPPANSPSPSQISFPASVSAEDFEILTIENLQPNTPYFFTVQSINQLNALSEPSNITQASPSPGWQDNGDTIIDLYTGLMWPKDGKGPGTFNGTTTTQLGANALVTLLNNNGGFASHTDWRVPNFKELASIVAYNKKGPAVSQLFQNIHSAQYWTINKKFSSGINPFVKYKAWAVNFSSGQVEILVYPGQGPNYYLLPVRGPDSPSPLQTTGMDNDPAGCASGFQDHANQTFTDLCTGLTWSQTLTSSGSGALILTRWQNVMRTANDSTLAGYTNWRLPTVSELIGRTNLLPMPPQHIHWSLSQDYFISNNRWYVDLRTNIGATGSNPQTTSFYVRLVHE